MKTFQKIKSYDNELIFEERLKDKGSDVTKIEADDDLVITEKVDGSNAQVTNRGGSLSIYSHHKKLDESNTLNGFYGFVLDRPQFEQLPSNLSLFGEWLTPHKIKYKDEAYKKYYLFDIFDFEKTNIVAMNIQN